MKITSKWATYRTTGYTYQAGDDARATGGVHHHQIRRAASGIITRVADSNGRFFSAGKSSPATADQIATAEGAE